MIYSSWNIEQNTLKLVILGHFLPLYHLKTPKNQNFEKMKKFAGDTIILHMYPKSQSYDVWFLRNGMRQTKNFVILGNFLPFYPPPCPPAPNDPKNQVLKRKKKCLEILSFYR